MSELPEKKAVRQRLADSKPSPKNSKRTQPPTPATDSLPDHKFLPDYEDDQHHKQPTRILRDIVRDLRFQIVAGLLLAAILVTLAAPPLYRRVKVWRANQFMDQSEAVAKEGNMPKAMGFIRQAVLLAPGDEALFRRVRLFNAGIGDLPSLNALQNLMLEGQASPDEILVLAEQSLALRKTTITKAALEKLAAHPSARRTIIEMRLTAFEGNPQAAVDLARASLKDYPPAEGEKILLATAELVLKTNPEVSRQILLPISEKKTPSGIEALRLLANQQLTVSLPQALDPVSLANALAAHPLHKNEDLLQAAELRILANPGSKPASLTQLANHFSNLKEEDQIIFVRWLNRRQSYQEAIDYVGRERALSKTDWLLIYLDALAGLNRWNEVFTLLDANSVAGLSEGIRLLFLARAAQQSGDKAKADDSWREMQRSLLYEKPEVVSFVAAYAMRIGEREQASKAYTILARRRESALEGFLGLIRTTPKNSPAVDLIPVYTEFLEIFPNLEEARNDLTYLQLLSNQNVFDASFLAHDALKKSPNSLAAMSLSALAHLRNGDSAMADEIYQDKLIAWSTAPDPWKNIRAAVLYASGKKSEADELAAMIDRNQLRPEERALLPAE
jgi:hypothetical protein